MYFPNRRAAASHLALLLPPLVMTVLAFITLARVDSADLAVGTPLDATPVVTPDALAQAQDHFETGLAHQARGNFAAAEQAYRAALAIDPSLAPVHNALGGLYVTRNQPAAALEFYRQAVALDPATAEWQRNLGVVQANLGDLAAAVAALETATRLDPDNAGLFYELGQIYAHRQQFEPARAAFGRALELDPNGPVAVDATAQLRQLPTQP